MRTTLGRLPHLCLVGLLCLIAIASPSPLGAATPPTTACTDGYALWANSRSSSDTLLISGSDNTVGGATRSNADILLAGSRIALNGPVSYTTSFSDGGDGNRYPTPARAVAASAPVEYSIASYRPGGRAATAAAAAGRYTLVNGDLDLSEPRTLNGLYYVTGNAKLSASNLRGTATVVAEGEIDVSGSLQQLSPFADGVLLFSNKREPGAAVIKLAGSDSTLRGVIYGPGGMVELSGGNVTIAGLIVGDTLKLAGSGARITFAGVYCPSQTAPAPAYVPGEIVVKLFNPNDLKSVAEANGLNPEPLDQFGTRAIYRLAITDNTDPAVKAAQLRPAGGGGDLRVEYAEPNFLAQDPESRGSRGSWVIGGANATTYAEQWAPAQIRLPAAHQRTRGDGITVAVLDTGVDTTHPALAPRLTPGYDFVNLDADPSEVGEPGLNPAFGHGTHVAGLVALAAPLAKIMPVRVLDPNGVGNVWVLSEGLLYAVERGPDGVPFSGDEPKVVNLSLGTLRETRLLEDLIGEVTCDDDDDNDDDDDDFCRASGGVVVIAAAGNGGDSTPQYPAAENVPGSLAVGASTRFDTAADFSTFGSWVRIAAPGVDIVSTVPGGAYGVWSGSSMAAPLAAGVAALVRSAEPRLSPVAVADRLVATARPIIGPIPVRLDAAAALGLSPDSSARPGTGTSRTNVVYLPLIRRDGVATPPPFRGGGDDD